MLVLCLKQFGFHLLNITFNLIESQLFPQAAGAYLIRVSFGTALIASIILVYTTIIVLISSQRYATALLILCFLCNHFGGASLFYQEQLHLIKQVQLQALE